MRLGYKQYVSAIKTFFHRGSDLGNRFEKKVLFLLGKNNEMLEDSVVDGSIRKESKKMEEIRRVVMKEISREELEKQFKEMVLNAIEGIIKHNNKAAEMVRSGDFNKEDVASFHKKLLNLVHILYPVRNVARMFIQKEHPEFEYILDFVEKTHAELEEGK